ncbi:hypothetical protein BDQ17DRAFT_1437543 [Cyathus striatus]|nr:hypothetical protein BDQ17DRAFT_1437543 [Cyathus striatus]
MLFRADFFRQKTSRAQSTRTTALSKIIGNNWHKLPLDLRAEEEDRLEAVAVLPTQAEGIVEEERRCEEVVQLLLVGEKGVPSKRPSSVPLPGDNGALAILRYIVSHSSKRCNKIKRPTLATLPLFYPLLSALSALVARGMYLQIDSAEADTFLFNPRFLYGFATSGYPQAFSDILPPYSMYVDINPFRAMEDLIAPLSQSISPLQAVQAMEMYSPDVYHAPAGSHASVRWRPWLILRVPDLEGL